MGIRIETDLDALAESMDPSRELQGTLADSLDDLVAQARLRAPRRTGALAAGFERDVRREGGGPVGEVFDLVPYAGVARRRKGAPLVADELVYEPAEEAALDAIHAALDALGAE